MSFIFILNLYLFYIKLFDLKRKTVTEILKIFIIWNIVLWHWELNILLIPEDTCFFVSIIILYWKAEPGISQMIIN